MSETRQIRSTVYPTGQPNKGFPYSGRFIVHPDGDLTVKAQGTDETIACWARGQWSHVEAVEVKP